MNLRNLLAVVALGLVTAAPANADEVTIKNVHLCCPACEKGVQAALKDAQGITDVTVDRKARTVKFDAANSDAAKSGLTALLEAGFYGTSSAAAPEVKVDATKKQNEVKISGLHLCCGACTKAASAALNEVGGVESLAAEQKAGSIVVKGKDISLAETLQALHDAGFHGRVE